ncbi:hypothetical protein E2C01_058901 [Portunus trituberculatus]|uniref:Uncharacterized protein n=1 Tax=Portunus trituberculatus TaxID=210409 RepID=A0A5B7GXM0_PORTR|nr:hypothetical protein [Portunus trituberculatus]
MLRSVLLRRRSRPSHLAVPVRSVLAGRSWLLRPLGPAGLSL